MKDFLSALKSRHSYYDIEKKSPVTDDEIRKLVEDILYYTPSAFNMQEARVLLLLGEHHDYLWKTIVLDALRLMVSPDKFINTENKINSFANGYGTVLFFTDESIISNFQQQFANYKDNFPSWAQHANGMLQINIWVALKDAGFGASLQHYNPLIDESVKSRWNIPKEWKLIAQMPFGTPVSEPPQKNKQQGSERILFFS